MRTTLLGIMLVSASFGAGYWIFRNPPVPKGSDVSISATAPTTAQTSASTNTTSSSPASHKLVITKATYGYGKEPETDTIDVTRTVAAKVEDASVALRVNNEVFGDPAFGMYKSLRVEYTLDGLPAVKVVRENRMLRIEPQIGPPKLVIVKAVFGVLPNGPTVDVTAMVAKFLDCDTLEVEVRKEDLGDPAPAAHKHLKVVYTFAGVEQYKTAEEGDTLTISNLGH